MTATYLAISAVMFLEFAVWGAWAPVLAARLLGPLKMSGKQTGWIYSTLPLACIIAPLIAGHAADKWVNAEWILAGCHLAGAVLLLVALRQRTFPALFVAMLAYSCCYAATLPLVNKVLFAHVTVATTRTWVWFWAPVAWALVGYALTGWRFLRKGAGEGGDCLVFAAVLSVVMAASCLFLPATAPAPEKVAAPLLDAWKLLQQSRDLAIFMSASVVIAGLMQFYFLGSAQFLSEKGVSSKAVPATMAIAQAAQAIATIVVFGTALGEWHLKGIFRTLGPTTTFVLGGSSWVILYLVYIVGRPRALLVVSQAFHGLAYVMFIIAGQEYAAAVAGEKINGSMQAILFAATIGVGVFLGSHLAGMTMDKFSAGGKFQWRKIWWVPMLIMLAATVALGMMFHGKL